VDSPPHIEERSLLPAVTLDIPPELLGPVVNVRFRQLERAARASVPKAAVYEDCELLARIGDVRAADVAPPLVVYAPVQAVTRVSGLPELAPYD
jgi:hypothetical protein